MIDDEDPGVRLAPGARALLLVAAILLGLVAVMAVAIAARIAVGRSRESDFDSVGSIEREVVEFPAELLLLTGDELAAWKADQQTAYRQREQEKLEARRIDTARALAAAERAEYARLKAKFEGEGR